MATAPFHHLPHATECEGSGIPEPNRENFWLTKLAKFFGEDADAKWGGQMFRISNDMMVVCDSDLTVLYHNRAFLRTIGYQSGSYVGASLLDFFPARDRNDADNAFYGLETGRASGLRINATMLTKGGEKQFDIRVVRSRRQDGGFNLYLTGRIRLEDSREMEEKSENPGEEFAIFKGLPIAVWRTDSKLKITQVSGNLWQTLGVDGCEVLGKDLTDSKNPALPRFLLDVDYCDTMAGLSLHCDVEWQEAVYEITVEPFVNRYGKVIGTMGLVRTSKQTLQERSAKHLQLPNLDPTEPIKPIPSPEKTREIEIGPPIQTPESVAAMRSNIQPRSLASTDVNRGPVEKPVMTKTGPIALAN